MVVRRFCSNRGVIRCLLAGAMVAGSFVAGEIRRETVVPRVQPAPPVAKPPQPAQEAEDADIPQAEVLRDGPFTARLKKRLTSRFRDVECSLVVLEKNGRRILTLGPDYGCEPYGSDATFEFCDLHPGVRMLSVEQYQYESSHSTIVALSPKPHIIFKSKDFRVNGVTVTDLDGDGTPELTTESSDNEFIGVSGSGRFMKMTKIVFRFDRVSGRYIPANPEFREYLLPGINEASQRVLKAVAKPAGIDRDLEVSQAIIPVVLAFVMIGEEEAGWEYFNRFCPNQPWLRKELRMSLEENPVYREIRKRKR